MQNQLTNSRQAFQNAMNAFQDVLKTQTELMHIYEMEIQINTRIIEAKHVVSIPATFIENADALLAKWDELKRQRDHSKRMISHYRTRIAVLDQMN